MQANHATLQHDEVSIECYGDLLSVQKEMIQMQDEITNMRKEALYAAACKLIPSGTIVKNSKDGRKYMVDYSKDVDDWSGFIFLRGIRYSEVFNRIELECHPMKANGTLCKTKKVEIPIDWLDYETKDKAI